MIRLFVAIAIPEDVRLGLAALAEGVPGASWIPDENYHVTLRFIGEVQEPFAEEACEALAAISAPAFTLYLIGTGHFGGESRRAPARALYAGVAAVEPLLRLQGKIEATLQSLGLPAETRKFKPHVTLARLRDTPLERIGAFHQRHGLFKSRPFEVDAFGLYESRQGQEASVYERLAEFPLLI